jgi:hypothetical protein
VRFTLAHAFQLEQWLRGLLVILEKTLGVILVKKLCAILQWREVSMWQTGLFYGIQMLNNVCEHNLMAEEIFSKKNRLANDGTLCKTLFNDII